MPSLSEVIYQARSPKWHIRVQRHIDKSRAEYGLFATGAAFAEPGPQEILVGNVRDRIEVHPSWLSSPSPEVLDLLAFVRQHEPAILDALAPHQVHDA